jgi:hypothetical protein
VLVEKTCHSPPAVICPESVGHKGLSPSRSGHRSPHGQPEQKSDPSLDQDAKKIELAEIETTSMPTWHCGGRTTRRKPMSDENTLEHAAAKAVRAEALLDDEILSEAFAALENSYIAAWRATTVNDATGREKLFLAINIVGKVRDHLAGVVANGKLARAELKELAETAERRKRFGII